MEKTKSKNVLSHFFTPNSKHSKGNFHPQQIFFFNFSFPFDSKSIFPNLTLSLLKRQQDEKKREEEENKKTSNRNTKKSELNSIFG